MKIRKKDLFLRYLLHKDLKKYADKNMFKIKYYKIFKKLHITRSGSSGQEFYKWFNAVVDEYKN
ncbi:MAG: hypothetical protein H6611_09870 [Ignavibacteriales bacterium]|nr:hypothetical protein [Ignavibacteriales bacterium]